MRVSVLDQSISLEGRAPADSIRETIALARYCEGLGYYRYWVSEHHNNPGIAGSAPEVLLGALAVATTTMRIGAAGIMLPHYAPLKVAEQFRVLEALAPGRVDMGLGRGPGADRVTGYALKPWAMDNPLGLSGSDEFPQAVEDVLGWVRGEAPEEGHPFEGVRAQPLGPGAPQPWIIGSTAASAGLAGALGLPFCFAHFFHDGEGAEAAIGAYRDGFVPSVELAAPVVSLCLWAMAAGTAEKAEALFGQYGAYRQGRDRGRPRPLGAGVAEDGRLRERSLYGTADDVVAGLRTLAGRHGADELVILGAAHDPADRRQSYRLIAEGMGLG